MMSSGHTSLPQNQVGCGGWGVGGRAGGFLLFPSRPSSGSPDPGVCGESSSVLGEKGALLQFKHFIRTMLRLKKKNLF